MIKKIENIVLEPIYYMLIKLVTDIELFSEMLVARHKLLWQSNLLFLTRNFSYSPIVLRRKKRDVSVFQELEPQDSAVNPFIQKKLKRQQHHKDFPVSDNSKVLKVSIIGTTNSGKSTLINKIVGHHVCPESMKPNTTRYNAR